ncbi:MAG: hypothetical protein AB1Z98_20785 [Nannocystaceae bacterium]
MMRNAPFRDAHHTLDTLTRTHRRVGIIPSSDDSLRYLIPIPRGWGQASGLAVQPVAGRPEILGLFAPTPDLSGPRIIVSATRLRWDVDPLLWVRHHWEAAGWSVAVARPLDRRWHPRFEVGALRRTEGTVEVRRTVGFVDNGRLLRVDTVAPSRQWKELHDALWPCGVLCSLAKPTYRREVEAHQSIGNSSWVAFGLPASWHAKEARAPWSGAERWVGAPADEVGGSVALRVDAMAWTGEVVESIAARQMRVRHELWGQGITLARTCERIHEGLAAGVEGLAGVFRATATDADERFEVRLAHRYVDGVMADYTMLVASPQEHPLDFMRASRALEIAIASTQVRPTSEEHGHAA